MAAKSHHARLFEQLIAEHRQKMVDALLQGLPEWHYREMVGTVRGLDDALRLSEEADFKLSGE